jgi:hypothetical protein
MRSSSTVLLSCSNRVSRYPLLVVLSIVWLTACMTGCDFSALSELPNVITQLQTSKDVVESFATDLKKSLAPDSPEYQAAQAQYEDARNSYTAYMEAAKISALNGHPDTDLSAEATAVVSRSVKFVSSGAETLSPDGIEQRSLDQLPAVLGLPPALPKALCALPKKQRVELIKKWESSLAWRSWRDLR